MSLSAVLNPTRPRRRLNYAQGVPDLLIALTIAGLTSIALLYGRALIVHETATPVLTSITCPDGHWHMHFDRGPDVVSGTCTPGSTGTIQ